MEAKNLGYSTKNIPLSNKEVYIKELIGKTEHFLRRLRWKVYHFLKNNEDEIEIENFGFRTLNTPPRNQILYNFENDLYEMIRKIEFETVRTEFQRKLSEDLRSINRSNKIFVSADKTRNIYELDPKEYDKLVSNNVTKSYKKSNIEAVNEVNKEAAAIAEKLKIDDRVQCIAENETFITIKDHKPNFPNNITCRLLNPCKSEIGRISKVYLENINNSIRTSTNLNQWRNSRVVIDWFKSIPQKKVAHFIKFDIVSFYPSISKNVLSAAIEFAKNYYDIKDEMVNAIMNSRKAFLFYDGNPWVKKDTLEHFDVTEGSFDGAEVCELVGLFLLYQLRNIIKNGSVGVYRDDGLAVVHKYSGPQMDRLRKNVIDFFKQYGFQITIDINLKITEFLDIYLDLENDKFYPFTKPNDTPLYVHRESNHPLNILKQLPKMTSERLSNLSCNEEEFKKVSVDYEQVLKNSGFKEKLAYTPLNQRNRRQRHRKVIWYNPPFDLQVKTNIGKTFLQLLDRNFPSHHRLHKIINRNTVKISYSCMPNIAAHISSHNKNIMQVSKNSQDPNPRMCDCQLPENCPLSGKCKQSAVIYNADVKPELDLERNYFGLTEGPFKERLSDHKTSFKYEKYKNKSKLSSFIWETKKKKQKFTINWSIVRRSTPYKAGSNKCNLCLWEKFHIMKGDKDKLLNERNELITKCRHVDKFLLKNYKGRRRGRGRGR